MMRSMFAGVSGLRSHQIMMDVVGNNIANVNTTGFKASRVLFQDTLSQLIRGGSGGSTDVSAGVNPQQVGLGVRVGSTDIVFSQGGSQLTGRATDVAIQGDGFFVVRLGPEQVYTRAGSFSFDQDGFMVDPNGAVVQGWLAGEIGDVVTNGPVTDIQLPINRTIAPVSTSQVMLSGNLSSSTAVGADPIISSINVIDAQGTSHAITFEFTKTADNTWQIEGFDPAGASMGTDTLTFDPASGEITSPATDPSFSFTPPGGADALSFTVDLGVAGSGTAVTQFGGSTSIAAIGHNGTTAGYLRAFAIADDGTVSGVFSNGQSMNLAKIALAKFTNPSGLVKAGSSLYRPSSSSGSPLLGLAGSGGMGQLNAGTLEMSNVDLSQEFTNLIIAQRGFQANSRIISASDEMLQDLVNLKR